MTTLVHPGLGDLGGVIALGTQQPRSMGWTLRGLGHQGGLPGHEPLAASTAPGPLWSRPQLTSQAHRHLHPATATPKIPDTWAGSTWRGPPVSISTGRGVPKFNFLQSLHLRRKQPQNRTFLGLR